MEPADSLALVAIHVYLGHGASGSAASMQAHVDGLRRRGFAADAIDLPVRKAEDAVPAQLAAVPGEPGTVGGGQSYGGRVASLAAAQADVHYAGLVLFCYPLHRPGQPDGQIRVAHWPRIDCPVLLLSGESDPFARIDLLRKAVKRLPNAELVTYPKLGHGLGRVLDDALDRTAAFLRQLG